MADHNQAVVVDIGSSQFKAGFSGQDIPCVLQQNP